MKRILVASILGIAATATYGQGVIEFWNYSANPVGVTQVTWGPLHPAGYNTGSFVNSGAVSLWVGTGVLSSSSALVQIATAPLFIGSGGGGWYDMGVSSVGLGYAQIPSSIYSGSQTLTFQVRGTSGTGTGASALWQESPVSAGGAIDPSSPNPMLNGPLALVLNQPVPEPTTLALAGLGAAGLLFFRKRQ